MSDRMKKYADWLVANQNKKGTPEFDAVAQAYKQLRQQPQLQQPATQQQPAQQPQQANNSFLGALQYGTDQVLNRFGETADALGAESVGAGLSGAMNGPQNYESAGGRFINPQEGDMTVGGFGVEYLPRAIAEQSPQLAGTVATMAGGAAVGGMVAGPPGAVVGGIAAPVLFEVAQILGPAVNDIARNNGRDEPEWSDWAQAAAVAGASGLLNRLGIGKGATGILNKTLREGTTEGAQSAVEQIGTTAGTDVGLQFDPKQAVGEGIIGAGTGTALGVAQAPFSDTNRATAEKLLKAGIKIDGQLIGNDPEAAYELATRLERRADVNKLNVNNVSKGGGERGARELLDSEHDNIATTINTLASTLSANLKPQKGDTLDIVLEKIKASAGQRQGRNKRKSLVGVDEMRAVERLVGNTAEGQRLLAEMRISNELSNLFNQGFVGGVSQYTDQLSPIPTNTGYSDRNLIEIPTRLLGTLYGASINPIIPAFQAAAVGTGRVVDAITGKRSRVASYIRENSNRKQGGIDITAPSMLDAAAAESEAIKAANAEDRARAKEIHKDQYERNGELPFMQLQAILDERGLSPQRAVQLLEAMAKDPLYTKDAEAMIRAIKEGGRFANMTPMAAAMKAALNRNTYGIQRDRPVKLGVEEQFNSMPRESAGYIRGIESNRAANDELVEKVLEDPSIAPEDQAVLIDALADLRGNLGSKPAERAFDIANQAEALLMEPELADQYLMPYVYRVYDQQGGDAAAAGNPDIEMDAQVPEIGGGQAVRPVPPKQTEKVIGEFDAEGQYMAMPQGDIISGNTYDGARIYINPNGMGGMEVDATQQRDAKPDKSMGKRFKTNLFKKFNTNQNGKKTNSLWTWVNKPADNTRTDTDQEFLVSFVSGGKHYYTTDLQLDVPTELDKDRANINAGNQPFLRPSGYGEFALGEQVGTIRTSNGNIHPLYESIRVEPKRPELDINLQKSEVASDPFNIGNDMGMTSAAIAPTAEELAQMRAGTFKPAQKKKLEEAYRDVFEMWKEVSGLEEALPYTPENVDRIGRMMATEALRALQNDDSAIGWYDAKLRAAKSVLRLVEPRIDANEAAFDFALAVTSNGQAVTENFKYALDVFRRYLDTGVMPEDFKQGGERNAAMIKSFKFFNQYNASGANLPIDMFLDSDFSVSELKVFLKGFNEKHGTDFSIGSQENADAVVKGSYVLGPKIGQGFYQNLRGNFEPLTMDIWWMRMWNRLVGRPFEAPSQPRDIAKRFETIKRGMIDTKDKDMKQLVKQALENTGETRKGLYSDPDRFNPVIAELNKLYQSYYKRYKQENGKNHNKPKWMASVGTHVQKMGDKMMASPAGGTERAYMREVTLRARELLADKGYDINTADFQALMWYPEKQLAEKMGIAKGKGQDNDYLDAAILAADREGITNEQIQEALPDAERERLFGGTSGDRPADEGPNSGPSRAGREELVIERQTGLYSGYTGLSNLPSTPARAELARQQVEALEQLFPEGKPIPIGQKGTIFENGLQPEAAAMVAEALNYAFMMHQDYASMAADIKARTDGDLEGPASGVTVVSRNPKETMYDRVSGKIRRGFIYGLGPGNKETPTLADSIFTLMHELGHAIERLPMDDYAYSQIGNYVDLQGKDQESNKIYNDTFRGYLTQILDAASGKSKGNPSSKGLLLTVKPEDARAIIDEVIAMQRTGILNVEGAGQAPVRSELYNAKQTMDDIRKQYPGDEGSFRAAAYQMDLEVHENGYTHTPWELAGDMIAMYLTDPQTFKARAPSAAAFVQTILNRANSPTSNILQFYSAPLATVLAVIAATMAAGEEEEENKKAVLNMGTGALTL